MSSYWKDLSVFYNANIPQEALSTITFDTRQFLTSEPLTERINNHGGGGTLIVEAF